MNHEDDVLARYSTPGLRRRELDRAAKKDQLLGQRFPREDIEKVLNQLYPPPPAPKEPST